MHVQREWIQTTQTLAYPSKAKIYLQLMDMASVIARPNQFPVPITTNSKVKMRSSARQFNKLDASPDLSGGADLTASHLELMHSLWLRQNLLWR